MVTVALDPFRYVLLPEVCPGDTSTAILVEPLVVKFIHHQDTVLVAKVHEIDTIRIVGGADVVHPKRFEQL